jgi:hypothetical protein
MVIADECLFPALIMLIGNCFNASILYSIKLFILQDTLGYERQSGSYDIG